MRILLKLLIPFIPTIIDIVIVVLEHLAARTDTDVDDNLVATFKNNREDIVDGVKHSL